MDVLPFDCTALTKGSLLVQQLSREQLLVNVKNSVLTVPCCRTQHKTSENSTNSPLPFNSAVHEICTDKCTMEN